MCASERGVERDREREGEQLVAVACVCVCVWQCDLLLPHKHTRHTQALSVYCTLGSRSLPLSLSLFLSLSLLLPLFLLLRALPLVRSINKCLRSKLHTNWMTWPVYWLTDWLIDQSIGFRLSVCSTVQWVCVWEREREEGYKKLITFKLAARLTFQFTGKVRRSFILNLIKQLIVMAAACWFLYMF